MYTLSVEEALRLPTVLQSEVIIIHGYDLNDFREFNGITMSILVNGERAKAAADLYRQMIANRNFPLVIFSGGNPRMSLFMLRSYQQKNAGVKISQARRLQNIFLFTLNKFGISPPRDIIIETNSNTTAENAIFSIGALLQRFKQTKRFPKAIIAVSSSGYHMPRVRDAYLRVQNSIKNIVGEFDIYLVYPSLSVMDMDPKSKRNEVIFKLATKLLPSIIYKKIKDI